MASILNSSAAFAAFLREINLDSLLSRFVENGWETYGDFGFACSAPSDPEKINEEIIQVLIGAEPKPEGDEAKDKEAAAAYAQRKRMIPRIRRAYATATQLVSSETVRLTSSEPDPTIKLHPAERESRRRALCLKITGFQLQGELDPSTRLIDRLATILQSGCVKYVGWSRCTSARQELLEQPEVQQLTLGAGGVLVKAAEGEGPECDVSTDLLIDSALRRRALAGEVSGLITYDAMQSWHELLKESLLTAPPPSYARVSYSQLLNADMELWRQVAAKCRDGCKQITTAGCTAFQAAWLDSMSDLRLRLFLAPLPRVGGSSSSSSGGPPGLPNARTSSTASLETKLLSKLGDLRNEMNHLKRKASNNGALPKQGAKGKGKGKKRSDSRMPRELAGMTSRTPDGEPICFGYNMARGCSAAVPGQSCSHGKHVCCKPGCFGTHPVGQCSR